MSTDPRSWVVGCACVSAALVLVACSGKAAPGSGTAGDGDVPPSMVDGGDSDDHGPSPTELDPNLGLTWSAASTGTEANLWDVVWTGARLFAVGAGGTVLSSIDGASWTSPSSGAQTTFTSVAWTGARLVALDTNGLIFTSEDGAAWTPRFDQPSQPMTVLGKVGATIVAVGGAETDHWAVSKDGISWTVRHDPDLTSAFLSGCASGPAQLVCVGWRNGFNVSQATAFATSDGVAWKDVSPDFAAAPLRGAGWKDDDLLAVGELGAMLLRLSTGAWFYHDTWATLDDPNGTKPADAVVWTGKRAVAVGQTILITSETGNPYGWKLQPTAAAGRAIAFTGRRLVVVGDRGRAFVSPSVGSSAGI